MMARAGAWVGSAAAGGPNLTDMRVWTYQDFAAGSGPGLTITASENGNGIAFSAARIVNGSAVVTKTNGNPIYNSTTEIPANLVSVSAHTGASVTLDGTPAVGEGTVRIWYLYAMANTDTGSDLEIAPRFVTEARTIYLDAQFLNAQLNLSDLTSAPTARLNLGFTAQTAGQVLYGDGSTTFTSEADFFWDSANNRLGILDNTPSFNLDVNGTGRIVTSLITPILYGGTASGDDLTISSTSDSTKGDIILGQSYQEFSTGKLRIGDIAAGAPASTMLIAFKTTAANPYISFENSAAQRWILAAESSQLQFNRQANDLVGFALDTSNRFTIGDGGATFMASFKNAGSTNTTISTAVSGDAVISVRNRNTTVNNFEGIVFENQASAWGAGLFGVNANHSSSPTMSLEAWVSDSGTKQRALNLAADRTITMDAYGTGIAHFSSAGVISSSAIANGDMATMPDDTVKGNVSGGAATPSDLTTTELTTLINTFTSLLSGAVPASGGGTDTFLRADGAFARPHGQKAGPVTLSIGSLTHAVTFATAKASANYSISWAFKNTVDSDPMIQPWSVMAQSTTGFTIEWSDELDSANYIGLWSVEDHYDP